MSGQMNEINVETLYKLDDIDLIDIYEDFMENHKIRSGDDKELTHSGITGGKWSILSDDYNIFLKLYKEINQRNLEYNFTLVERNKKVSPIICDIDLRTDKKFGMNKERLYTDNHVFKIAEIYLKTLNELFYVDPQHLQAYVFGRGEPPGIDKDEYKDGFHIYFPDIPLRVEFRYLVYYVVLQKMKEQKLFSDIPLKEPLEKVNDDHVIISNGVLMVGSCKKGRKPYILIGKYCMNDKSNTVYMADITDLVDDKSQLIELSSLRLYDDESSLVLRDNKFLKVAIECSKRKNYKTDLVCDDETELDTTTEMSTDTVKSRIKANKILDKPIIQTCICCHKPLGEPPADDVLIRKLVLEGFKKKRCDIYDTWLRVGWALHKIWHGYLDFFKEWSQTSSKYNDGGCEKIWRSANDSSYSLASIHKWAREDKPIEYAEIMQDKIKELINKTSLSTHDDLANIIFMQYKHQYRVADIDKNAWYEFNNHRWIPIQGGYTLFERISSEICDMLTRIQKKIVQDGLKCENENMSSDQLKEIQLSIKKIYEKLKDVTFKDKLMKACKIKFYDPEFLEKLNSNKKIIGFNNGVFDLGTPEFDKHGKQIRMGVFRDGTPDDYITFTTKYDWNNSLSLEDETIKDILDFFSKVQIREDVREYLLRLIAAYLDGSISIQELHFWPGSGGNGKSATIDLIRHTFGDYYSTMPVKILTGPTPDGNQATPAYSDKPGKRIVTVSEPAHNETLNISTMKILTGGDPLPSRALYSEMKYFVPQFKMLIACNNLPRVPSLDGGTWRRVRVLSFDSKFLSKIDYDKIQAKGFRPNYFVRDSTLMGENGKLSKWGPAFAWLLLTQVYQRYYVEETAKPGSGLRVPEKVEQDTEKYRISSDKYYEYLSKNIIKTSEADDKVEIKKLYDLFKRWFKNCYHNQPPTIQEFSDYLATHEEYKTDNAYIYEYKLVPEGYEEVQDDFNL